jgi:hypothetical protein
MYKIISYSFNIPEKKLNFAGLFKIFNHTVNQIFFVNVRKRQIISTQDEKMNENVYRCDSGNYGNYNPRAERERPVVMLNPGLNPGGVGEREWVFFRAVIELPNWIPVTVGRLLKGRLVLTRGG